MTTATKPIKEMTSNELLALEAASVRSLVDSDPINDSFGSSSAEWNLRVVRSELNRRHEAEQI